MLKCCIYSLFLLIQRSGGGFLSAGNGADGVDLKAAFFQPEGPRVSPSYHQPAVKSSTVVWRIVW